MKKIKNIYYWLINPIVYADYNNAVLTLKDFRGNTRKYTGSCTVWNTLPSMYRTSSITDGKLYRFYQYNRFHGKPYIKNYK